MKKYKFNVKKYLIYFGMFIVLGLTQTITASAEISTSSNAKKDTYLEVSTSSNAKKSQITEEKTVEEKFGGDVGKNRIRVNDNDYVRAYQRPGAPSAISVLPDYTDLTVQVGDETLELYHCAWRNIGQFEYSGSPEVIITAPAVIDNAVIYPSPYGVEVTIDENICTFDMPEAGSKMSKIAVSITDVNGNNYQVDLLGDQVENERPDPDDPNVFYFAARDEAYKPGENGLWTIENADGKMIYIEEGAVVQARINIVNSDNFTVSGKGMLIDSRKEHGVSSMLSFHNSNNVKVEDIIIGASNYHIIKMYHVDGGEIHNLKEAAAVSNTDGITISSGSKNIFVEDCFIAVNDDSLVINADTAELEGMDNIRYENLVIANRTNGYKLSFRSYTYGIVKNISFKNIYCIQSPGSYGFMKTSYKDPCGIWLHRLENLVFDTVYIENASNRTLMNYTSMNVTDGEEMQTSLTDYGHIIFRNFHHQHQPTISAPENLYIVMDHCTYGEDNVPIAEASDMKSVSGTVEYVTGSDVPSEFIPPVLRVIPKEPVSSGEGTFVTANDSITVTDYNGIAPNLQIKWTEPGLFPSNPYKRNGFVKFDLSDVNLKEVTVARLWLHSDYYIDALGKNIPVDVYKAGEWSRDTITEEQPDMKELLDSKVVHKFGWVSFDITPAVQYALQNDEILSLGIRQKSEESRSYNEFSGCLDNNPPCVELIYYEDGIPVSGIFLDNDNYHIAKGDSLKLKATIQPDNAANKEILWTTSNPDIVTVDESGLIFGNSNGTATITATSVDGGFTASAIVEVGNSNTIEWNFNEWGTPSSAGTSLASDYTLGEQFDYNGLKIVFSNNADRMNKSAFGVYFRYSYSSSHPSYVSYIPEQNGKITVNGKAIRIRKGSLSGEIIAENTDTGKTADLIAEVEMGTQYYIVSTANSSGRIINIQFKYLE